MPCDGLPPSDPKDVTAIATGYDALVRTAAALGPAREGPIGLVSISFGAGVALDAAGPVGGGHRGRFGLRVRARVRR